MPERVRVVPLVPTRSLGGPLDYLAAAGEPPPRVGEIVQVPLGGRRVRGVVVPHDSAPTHGGELREIAGREPRPPVAPLLVELALWLGAYYGSTPARALALVLPPPGEPAAETVVLPGAHEPTAARRRAIRRAVGDGLPLREALARAATTRDTVRRMAEAGELVLERRLDRPALPPAVPAHELDADQAAAVARLRELLEAAAGGDVLLHGVTGSGKTEVYLAAIEHCLARGRSALVLVPEIALTPQTAGRIAARFGDRVAVLHSALSAGERAAAHARVRLGEADVVVGPRSAVFAPLARVGLIVVDEEHDASYKQADDPRYDARRVAAKRARLEGAVLLACSATPRPESWRALERLTLPRRVGGSLPPVEVVDLRRDGNYPLSRPLRDRLVELADHGGRAILLLNRRGEAPALHCRGCGRRFGCARCDVSLSLHGRTRLRCHHCGHAEAAPTRCPDCGAVDLARLGAGTERLADAVLEVCGAAVEVLRLDRDATRRRGALEETLARFAAAPAAVLVGTQMVAKGHDFRGLRLAAAIDADQGLAWPDFRSEERTFALLAQLAGRSGRSGDSGRVVIQAWDPSARVVELAARHAVEEFLEGELQRRELLGYPPFRHLVRVEVAAPGADTPELALAALRAAAAAPLAGDDLLGPAPLFRLRDRNRAQLLVKTHRPAHAAAVLGDLVARQTRALRRARATVVVDVDPQ